MSKIKPKHLVPTLISTLFTLCTFIVFPANAGPYGSEIQQEDAVNAPDIERIEVIKGPSSSLYGSNALGGVINLISKKQIDDGPIITTSLKHASHNTTNSSLIYQYKEGSFQISNSLDYYKTDGYDLITTDLLSTVNPYSNFTFRSNLKFALSNALTPGKVLLEFLISKQYSLFITKNFLFICLLIFTISVN